MLKIRYLSNNEQNGTVVVLGFFDAVHAGHAELIREAGKTAAALGKTLSVFTFSSLPTKRYSSMRILTESERESVLASLGVDAVYTVDFEDVKDMEASAFVSEILISEINASVAYCGENFKFGKSAKYRFADLKEEMQKHGRDAVSVTEMLINEKKISTSEIKEFIILGRLEDANKLLYHSFFIENTVEKGMGIGKALGFPTLNLEIPDEKIKPKNGVYKSIVTVDNENYAAVTNIGTCPTFSERKIHTESFIPDAEIDLYGKRVRVHILSFIRDEIKFDNADDLVLQIKKDIESVREN